MSTSRLILRLSEYALSVFCLVIWAYLLLQEVPIPAELGAALGAGFALGLRRPSDWGGKGNVDTETQEEKAQ